MHAIKEIEEIPMFKFNDGIIESAVQQHYAQDARTRIGNLFEESAAQSLYNALNTSNVFDFAYVNVDKPALLSPQTMATMSREQQQKMRQEVLRLGSQGIGYLYGRHLIEAHSETMFTQVKEWLNSDTTITFMQNVSGHKDISFASAQATKYMPGHFLTRHQDVHPRETRRLAYVINLTPKWHPDWGGLLQFYETNGTPRDSWAPIYNSMSLFDVKHIHSVTYVTPMALAPRLSITGWFIAK